jgi:molybdopterin-containing oxidoreductase family membrane subunit
MAVFWATQRGAFAPLYWTMVVCNFVVPLAILTNPKTRTIAGCVTASFGVVIGMWLERFLIVVPSLTHKQLPYSWGTFQPTPVELTIMAATFAAMILLYALFAKFVPIISIWELKAGLPSRLDPATLAEASLMSTRLSGVDLPPEPEEEHA